MTSFLKRKRRQVTPSQCQKPIRPNKLSLVADHIKAQDIVITTGPHPRAPGTKVDQLGHGGFDEARDR